MTDTEKQNYGISELCANKNPNKLDSKYLCDIN